jgi:ribosomal protein S13
MSDILLQTLAGVIAELVRLDPQNLVAARAIGVLEAAPLMAAPRRGRVPQPPNITDAKIAARYAAGATLLDLASEFEIAVDTARRAIVRAGGIIRRQGPTDHRKPEDHPLFTQMKAMWEGGNSMKAIGDACGVSRERVRQILTKAGIHATGEPKRLTSDELAAVHRYFDEDLSLSGAAHAAGFSEFKMARLIRRAGYEPRKANRRMKDETAAKAARAADLYKRHVKIVEIAKDLKLRSPELVYRYLAIAGVKPDRQNRDALRLSPITRAA